jgi:hypothetical protein
MLQRPRLSIQKVIPPGPAFEVDFNPEEYTVSKDNNFAAQAIPGLSAPLLQYVNGNLRTLEMELLFDTYDTKDAVKADVRTRTSQVTNLLQIESDTHAPAVLLVSWASLQFTCVLARVTQKFMLFAGNGTPVRARLNVTFQEYVDPEHQAKADNKQTADFTKAHTVTAGETLDVIAAAYYDDPTQWRPIAIANGLDDPSRLDGKTRLIIPALPYRDPSSGQVVS